MLAEKAVGSIVCLPRDCVDNDGLAFNELASSVCMTEWPPVFPGRKYWPVFLTAQHCQGWFITAQKTKLQVNIGLTFSSIWVSQGFAKVFELNHQLGGLVVVVKS